MLLMGKSTIYIYISMAMFNSKLLNYQRVKPTEQSARPPVVPDVRRSWQDADSPSPNYGSRVYLTDGALVGSGMGILGN